MPPVGLYLWVEQEIQNGSRRHHALPQTAVSPAHRAAQPPPSPPAAWPPRWSPQLPFSQQGGTMLPGTLFWPPGSSTPHPERKARQSSLLPTQSGGFRKKQPLGGWMVAQSFLLRRHLQGCWVLGTQESGVVQRGLLYAVTQLWIQKDFCLWERAEVPGRCFKEALC